MTATAFEDLIDHLRRTTSLGEGEVSRVVEEVLNYFSEDVVGYARRRHVELKERHFKNEEIFIQIRMELAERRFAAPEVSVRQLRRIIYG